MTGKKRKLKKSVKIGMIGLAVILFVIVAYKMGNSFVDQGKSDQNEFSYIAQNRIERKENAVLKISYPKFNAEEIDKKIEHAIQQKEEQFLQEVIDTLKINPDLIGELIIDYDVFTDGSLIGIHLLFSEYLGGANYMQENQSFYYDLNTKRVIHWEDLFEDPALALNQLSSLSLERLKNMNAELWEDEQLDEGLMSKKENFEHLYLSEEGMLILFPIYQVGPRSSGNIWISLGYDQVNDLLKSEYQGTELFGMQESDKKESKREMRDLSDLQNKKLIALTFDDGPSYGVTESLLDGLKDRNAKVTFFVLGSRVEQYPQIVQRAYQEGHTIASHSYDHKNLLNLDKESLIEDLNKTNKAVSEATGIEPFALRPPYGNVSQEVMDAAGMPIVLWDIDPEDWKNRDAEMTYQNILDQLNDGSIILLHDLYGTSVEAALRLIDECSEQGYAFVSLEELVKLGRISENEEMISGIKN